MSEQNIIVQYDPDFDAPAPASSSTDVMATLGATRAFWVGVALSILVQMSIGFLILLALYIP